MSMIKGLILFFNNQAFASYANKFDLEFSFGQREDNLDWNI